MEHQKEKVPNLRFKGFTNDWEERKLGEHAKYRRGSFPQPYGNKEWYDGEGAMPFVQVVDVTNNLTLVENTKQKISKLAQSKSVFVPKGTVVVTLQGSIGRVAITQYDSFVDRTLLIFEDYEKETDERFWAYTIQKKFEIEKLKAPGGTIKTITKEALSSFDVHLPQFKEQAKIGSFFKKIDDTIALHQRKLDLLNQLKNGFLQKMFADKGSKQPVLRFNGFSGDWDEVKLSDNSKIFIGLVTSMTKHYAKNGTFLVRNSDISENFISHHKPIYLDSKFAEKNNNRRMRTNDVVTVHTGNIGTSAVISEKENGAIGFATIVTRPDRNVWNALFLSDYLNTSTHKKWAIRMATGDGRNNYNLRDFIRIRVPNPGIDEQKKVSKFVQLIENNISDQQQEIRNLETLKKSLLQQMFI